MGPAIAEILSTITGPCFSYQQKRPTDIFDFEAGFPVSQPVAAAGHVKLRKLPAVKVVRTIYQGGYEGLGAACASFANGLKSRDLMCKKAYGNAI
ncbi:MAG: GyrI-like domain-containing protein [Methylococcaceae bacterium]